MEINNIKLNFLEKYYMFYEWLDTDNIEKFNKISVFRISSKTLNDFMNYQIRILDETIFSKHNPAIFSDTYSYIAIKFDNNGYSISKSSLLLEDEFRLNMKIDDLKIMKIIYNKIDLDLKEKELRINLNIRKTIELELNKIKEENNIEKLTYLYYEWFQKKENSVQKMFINMYNKLIMPPSENEKKVYEIIKKSYKLV